MRMVEAKTFEDGALLKANGFELLSADPEGGRIVLRFADPDGGGKALLRLHTSKGAQVNSLDMMDALRWAKDTIFRTRRLAGMD